MFYLGLPLDGLAGPSLQLVEWLCVVPPVMVINPDLEPAATSISFLPLQS